MLYNKKNRKEKFERVSVHAGLLMNHHRMTEEQKDSISHLLLPFTFCGRMKKTRIQVREAETKTRACEADEEEPYRQEILWASSFSPLHRCAHVVSLLGLFWVFFRWVTCRTVENRRETAPSRQPRLWSHLFLAKKMQQLQMDPAVAGCLPRC